MEQSIETILIKKAKQQNVSAFEKLILSYEKNVYNIAFRMFNNEEDAKDISQEVFIKVYKNIAKFDENSKFSTWLHRICVNTCIDEIRKRKGKESYSIDEAIMLDDSEVHSQLKSDMLTPEQLVIKKEDVDSIKNAISSLSDSHKTLIILRDIQGLSYTDIAEITGSTLGTVKSRISRARLSLKNIIIENKEQSNINNRLKNIKNEGR